MIKWGYFWKLLKQLFIISLISCFGLLGNFFVNAFEFVSCNWLNNSSSQCIKISNWESIDLSWFVYAFNWSDITTFDWVNTFNWLYSKGPFYDMRVRVFFV